MVTIVTTTTLGGTTLRSNAYNNRALNSINVNKTANVFHSALPQQDSEDSLLVDLAGTTKIITITGKVTGDTDTINVFIIEVEALEDGSQDTITFRSSYVPNDDGTDNGDVPKSYDINVMVGAFQYNWDIPGNRMTYTIQLLVGKSALSEPE